MMGVGVCVYIRTHTGVCTLFACVFVGVVTLCLSPLPQQLFGRCRILERLLDGYNNNENIV